MKTLQSILTAISVLMMFPGASAQEKPDRVPNIKEQVWRAEVLKVRPLRLTVEVLGEDGKPVEGVEVCVGIGNEVYQITEGCGQDARATWLGHPARSL